MKKELRKAIEGCGWSVKSNTCIENYSPAGEDLIIECSENENIANAIKSEYENYDVDEHIDLWVQYRGTKGVPSTYEALLKDAEEIEDMLYNLYEATKQFVG